MSIVASCVPGQYMRKTVSGRGVLAVTDCAPCVLPELIIFGSTDGTGEFSDGVCDISVEVGGTVYHAYADSPLRKYGDTSDCLVWSEKKIIRSVGTDGLLNEPVTENIICDDIVQNEGINIISCANTHEPSEMSVTALVYSYSGVSENSADVCGLSVDYENGIFTRLAGACGKNAGSDFDVFAPFGGRRRCNVADDGSVTAWYGDPDFTDDGSNGQVMVYQPKFYYRIVPNTMSINSESGLGYHVGKASYYVSAIPRNGFKVHPAFFDKNGNETDCIFFSAYEGSLFDPDEGIYFNDSIDTETGTNVNTFRICSVGGVKPISSKYKDVCRSNFENIASNRGEGWHCESIKTLCANILLMIIEYGNMNMQSVLGKGIVEIADSTAYNCSSLTGSTASLGNNSGQAEQSVSEVNGTQTVKTGNGKVAVSYRGMENPWGNIYKNINGINVWNDGSMGGGQPYICRDLNFEDGKRNGNYEPAGFTLPAGRGYANAIGYSGPNMDWLLMPSKIGGTEDGTIGDDSYQMSATSGNNRYFYTQYGGFWARDKLAGALNFVNVNPIGSKSRTHGGRLIFIPTV